jgi:SNARE protein
MTTKQILEKGSNIQKQDINALDNMLQTIEQTKETGVEIGNQLQQQTEQMHKVIEGTQEVQQYLKIASKELRAFARRVATDKLVMSFICLIVVGIIFVIVWQAVKGNKSKGKVDGGISTTTTTGVVTQSTTS